MILLLLTPILFIAFCTCKDINKIWPETESIEKDIVEVSRVKLDFTNIFKDAILGQVIYVRYDTNTLGVPEFKVLVSSDFALKKVKLGTKNGFTRSADKLGVQP